MAAISSVLRAGALTAGRGGSALTGSGVASEALAGLSGDIGNIDKDAKGASDAFKDLGGALGKATGGSTLLTFSMGQLDQALNTVSRLTNQYVRAFAPAEADLFTLALKDLSATIGEQLIPITRAGRDVVRFFSDAIGTLTPYVRGFIEEVINTFKPLFAVLGESFRQFMTAAMPAVQLMGELFVVVLEEVTRELTAMVQVFNRLLREFNAFFGLQVPDLADTRGKAFQPAQTTNIQAVLARSQEAAFGMGSESPQQQQISILTQIKTAIEKLPENIAKYIDKKSDQVADRYVRGVEKFFGQGAVDMLAKLPKFDR